jgi:hypothetical protein
VSARARHRPWFRTQAEYGRQCVEVLTEAARTPEIQLMSMPLPGGGLGIAAYVDILLGELAAVSGLSPDDLRDLLELEPAARDVVVREYSWRLRAGMGGPCESRPAET